MNFFNAVDEFKKDPQLKKTDINNLKEWIIKQPHLPPVTDELLILFLHSCFYRLEITKSIIESYFTLRTHTPEFFSKRNIESVLDVFNVIEMMILPGLTPNGCKVIFVYLKRTEPELLNPSECVKVLSMIIDMLLMNFGTFNGLIIVYDMKSFGFGHIGRLSVNILKKYIYFLQEALPARLHSIHALNINSYVEIVHNLMKPFLKKDLLEKLFYHQANSNKIYDYVPKDMMPIEVGGNGKSVQSLNEDTLNTLKGMNKWFLDEELLRVDEKKRLGKPKSESDLFGTEGSFKTLTLD